MRISLKYIPQSVQVSDHNWSTLFVIPVLQVATFIIYKILLHEEGLKYCCVLADRFFAVARALAQMTEKLVEQPSPRLLKHIICCYHRLSQSPRSIGHWFISKFVHIYYFSININVLYPILKCRACDGLRCCLPLWFGDRKFTSQLHVRSSKTPISS